MVRHAVFTVLQMFGRRRWRYPLMLALVALAAFLGRRASFRLIALLVAAVALLVLIRDLRWGLLALPAICLLLPMEIGTGTEVSLNLAVLAVPALGALWLARRLLDGDLYFAPSRLNRPLVAFLAAVAFSLFLGNALWDPVVPRPSNLILVQLGQISIYVLSFASLWLTANAITDVAWLRRVAYAFVGLTAFVLVLLFLKAIALPHLPIPGVPNLVWVWAVSLSLSLAVHDRRLNSWQRRALFLVVTGAIAWLWIFEREYLGGWMPSVASLGFILWQLIPRSRRWLVVAIGVLAVVVGLSVFLAQIDWESEWAIAGETRLSLWSSVIELASRRPLFGLGIAAYRHYHFLKPLTHQHITWVRPRVSAHNMFIDLFAQMGVLGLACYIWFLVQAALTARRLYIASEGFARGYTLAVLGALVGTFFADMVAETSLPFVYNMGFGGFRGSVLGWMLLGGIVVLEGSSSGSLHEQTCGADMQTQASAGESTPSS